MDKENIVVEEKNLTLKSLEKQVKLQFEEMQKEISALKTELETVKKSLRRA